MRRARARGLEGGIPRYGGAGRAAHRHSSRTRTCARAVCPLQPCVFAMCVCPTPPAAPCGGLRWPLAPYLHPPTPRCAHQLHRPLGRAGHRARLEARTTLVPTLRRDFAKHTRAQVIERAVAHGVPVAPHNDFEALLADRQVWDNDYVVERHGHVHVGVAAQFEKTKAGVRGPCGTRLRRNRSWKRAPPRQADTRALFATDMRAPQDTAQPTSRLHHHRLHCVGLRPARLHSRPRAACLQRNAAPQISRHSGETSSPPCRGVWRQAPAMATDNKRPRQQDYQHPS